MFCNPHNENAQLIQLLQLTNDLRLLSHGVRKSRRAAHIANGVSTRTHTGTLFHGGSLFCNLTALVGMRKLSSA
jgi:hypothetical protein